MLLGNHLRKTRAQSLLSKSGLRPKKLFVFLVGLYHSQCVLKVKWFVHLLQEEPAIIKRNIDLKYKVFGKKRSEDSTMKAGSLTVSAVFRPVESVAKSGEEISLDIRSREYELKLGGNGERIFSPAPRMSASSFPGA